MDGTSIPLNCHLPPASILNGPSFLKIFVILGGKVKRLISNLQYVKECPTLSQFSEFTQY